MLVHNHFRKPGVQLRKSEKYKLEVLEVEIIATFQDSVSYLIGKRYPSDFYWSNVKI